MLEVDPTKKIPCRFSDLESLGDPAFELGDDCANGRTGTSFLAGGFFMLWSGSKLLIPRLRAEENQYLLLGCQRIFYCRQSRFSNAAFDSLLFEIH